MHSCKEIQEGGGLGCVGGFRPSTRASLNYVQMYLFSRVSKRCRTAVTSFLVPALPLSILEETHVRRMILLHVIVFDRGPCLHKGFGQSPGMSCIHVLSILYARERANQRTAEYRTINNFN